MYRRLIQLKKHQYLFLLKTLFSISHSIQPRVRVDLSSGRFWTDGAMKSATILQEFVMSQEGVSADMKAILNQLHLDLAH